MNTDLRRALDRVADRARGVRLWSGLAACWLAFALAGLGVKALVARPGPPTWGRWFLLAWPATLGAAGIAVAWRIRRSATDPRWIARRIEARYPELGTGLLAAVEEDAATPPGRRGYLQAAVVAQALGHARAHDWAQAVPSWHLRGAKLAHAGASALLVASIVAVVGQAIERHRNPGKYAAAAIAGAAEVRVDPGHASIEKGASLLVVARFLGAVPADARLAVDGSASLPMARSLEDPTFAGRVESVAADLAYRVEFNGRTTETYRVTVFEYPEVRRTDARLVFPTYTAIPTKVVEDIRHVTAVEGTELTLTCRLNKEVAESALIDEKGAMTPLIPVPDQANTRAATFRLTDSHRYKVRLVDREGRSSKVPAEVAVNVTRNRPAAVTMTRPGRDVRVSPVEELSMAAKAEDDFGILRHGLSYTPAGRDPVEIVLESPQAGTRAVKADHLLAFEALKARPDQLVTYHFWAEDVGPDGQTRRASGDLSFAEVRHFEEIFRQGEPPPSGSSRQPSANGRESEKLAELQKQIINATWTLIRRETGPKPTAGLAADAGIVRESQQSAIDQAGPLAEKLQNPDSKADLARAIEAMKDAERRLAGAASTPSTTALTPALAPEQAAYQALLKLRAREFEVSRQNSRSQGGGGQSGPSRQQLDQLQLSDEENRYEQQSSARSGSPQQQEQRETRQVLNRLGELARRQADLNDRLKELQAALEAAREPKAREEIERQLRRLRDQQQQILRDADEIGERMEREENRERMAEARQQLEQGRDHVRQASEALEKGQVSRAVTEGARAGRDLTDLRDDMRKKSSDRFSEELTEIRDQARRLDQKQGQLSDQLEARDRQPRPPSLRDDGPKDQARQGLAEQGQQLDGLLQRMRQTVQEAEETEPLLARGLFEAVRKANQQAIPDALKQAERLAEAGIAAEAARTSRQAGQGIEQLRQGVEKAARSVLGDETEALKRAGSELIDLADQVNREVARAGGPEPAGPPARDSRANPGPDGEDRPPGVQGRTPATPKGQQRGAPGDPPGQPGQQPGQGNPPGQQPESRVPSPESSVPRQPGQGNRPGGPRGGGGPGGRQAGLDRMPRGLDGGGPGGGPGGPITGEGFRQWSDRMRDVEDLLQDPRLRSEAARIRDRVRGAREEFKRHSKEPDPKQLKGLVADPIRELRDRVAEEVRRRESPDSLVPIDRDPVPPRYAEGVRRYYERLGSGR